MGELMAEDTNKAPLEQQDLGIWIFNRMKDAQDAQRDWRTNARRWYRFFAGDQWEEDDKAILEEQGRPAVVFNRVARTVNAVCGLEVQNRQEVRYIPREQSAAKVQELTTNVVKAFRDNCDAEDEESESFQDAVISGMGVTFTHLDYEEDPDGNVIIDREDPLMTFWDPRSRKRNLADRRWNAHVKLMTKAEIAEKWPDYRGGAGYDWLEDDKPETPVDTTPPAYEGLPARSLEKTEQVVCFEWCEPEEFYRVSTGDKLLELTKVKYERMQESIKAAGLKSVKQRRMKYRVAYVIGHEVLDTRDSPAKEGFQLNFITGMRDRNNNTWFGLVHLMEDPQRWANKWLSQSMHILNSNSKGGLMAEMDAFESPGKAEREWAQPDAITWMRPGALSGGKVQQKQPPTLPTGFDNLMRYAVESINDTPGVNSELLGLAERNQPGILEAHRKSAGVMMLGVLFASLRLYRKQQGRVMVQLIRDFVADGRLMRIDSESGQQSISLLRDPLTLKYDMVVDDAPNSPSQKDKTFSVMMQMLPSLLQAGIAIPPEILDHSPLPSSLIEKWKEMLKNAKQIPPEAQQKMQNQELAIAALTADLQKAQQEIFKLKTDVSVDMAKIEAQKEVKQRERALREEERAADFLQGQRDIAAKAEMQRQQLEAEREAIRLRAELEGDIALQKAAIDAEVKLILAKAQADADGLRMKMEADVRTYEEQARARTEAGNSETASRYGELVQQLMASNHEALEKLQTSIDALRAPRVVIRDEQGDLIGHREAPELH